MSHRHIHLHLYTSNAKPELQDDAGFDPNEPRNEMGEWSGTGSSEGAPKGFKYGMEYRPELESFFGIPYFHPHPTLTVSREDQPESRETTQHNAALASEREAGEHSQSQKQLAKIRKSFQSHLQNSPHLSGSDISAKNLVKQVMDLEKAAASGENVSAELRRLAPITKSPSQLGNLANVYLYMAKKVLLSNSVQPPKAKPKARAKSDHRFEIKPIQLH